MELGGHRWSRFFTVDADGDGQSDDTLLGYAGGNFVALNVSGLTLQQWNALVDGSAAVAEETIMLLTDAYLQPQSMASGRPQLYSRDPVAHGGARDLTSDFIVHQSDNTSGWAVFG